MNSSKLILTTKPKIGIIACSGENLLEGTITRVATRIVVEKLRPHITTILCQPLFMAGDIKNKGGGKEREFAKLHKTITVEGCEESCAKYAVERYSAPAAATIYVKEIMKKHPNLKPKMKEELNEDGLKLAEILAQEIAEKIDELYNAQ
ncbi:MAG TPA: putative zinc-binding protein [Candidatus Bathyarchaeia archaeon]|nr:putative zinc-binding protein [Candidatus Bathyarchaeia archaeon]